MSIAVRKISSAQNGRGKFTPNFNAAYIKPINVYVIPHRNIESHNAISLLVPGTSCLFRFLACRIIINTTRI
jgi:hypothetical protein